MDDITTRAGQIGIALILMAVIALATVLTVRRSGRRHDGSARDVYLAGNGLNWLFIAGSITLTNLSTEQLVGMNGNQMLLLAWWELAGFVGLLILAFVFVPIYYRLRCTTVTQLLEQRYGGGNIRTLISGLFLAGNIFVYLPAALYSGALFLKFMLGVDWPLWYFAAPIAVIAALYTICGGLRSVAVMDTYAGIGVLAIAILVVYLAMAAINFDFSGIPADRLTMIGTARSPIPFHTLFTGMIFIQIFYWSTNQNITQKAMTAPNVGVAQRGILAAAAIRILIIPAIVVIPGVAAYKLFGSVHDAAYGRLVGLVLPRWLSGAFAAMMASAVIAHTASILNSSVALYAVDLHTKLVRPVQNHWRLSAIVSTLLTISSVILMQLFENAQSIINLLQKLNGLLSMPILSAFVVGLLFRGVSAGSSIVGVVWGVSLYALYTFALEPAGIVTMHYIDFMVVTLASSVLVALAASWVSTGRRPGWSRFSVLRAAPAA